MLRAALNYSKTMQAYHRITNSKNDGHIVDVLVSTISPCWTLFFVCATRVLSEKNREA